jgi:hypothetical protein
MSDNQKKKWAEMTHDERVSYLEMFLNKKILFSTKLLNDYLHQLKLLDQQKKSDTIKIVEEAICDRLIKLGIEITEAVNAMNEENNAPEKPTIKFLTSNTDFGEMLPSTSDDK